MAEQIRIPDLANPVLTDIQKAALEFGQTLKIEFTEEAVLNAARERTGLSDFGSEDFLQRLNILLDEWGNDQQITKISLVGLFNQIVRYASNRLLINDLLKRHPEILDIKIEKPIIVAGLPRSGTTHLVNLLAADQRMHSLPLWESYEPIPLTGETLLKDGTDPRYQRCADQWAQMQASSPLMAAMHPMEPDHIHEELELMGPDFASYNFEWLAMSPKWRDHYYSQDQTPHYEYMKNVLKILQWQRGNKRWVLKCPQHMEQLTVLHNVFPDATIAITHRDPVGVIQSAITMQAYSQRIGRKKVELKGLLDYWSDRIEHLLRAYIKDRNTIPSGQYIDVPFTEFMADDLAMINKIYNKAGMELTDEASSQLQKFIDDHPRGKHGQVVYDLEGDFGISPDKLRERFGFYLDRFPI